MDPLGRVCGALLHVLLVTAGVSIPILLGWLDKAKTENGPDHYAEKPITFLSRWYPGIPMPLNTVVNVGYILVGAVWLCRTYAADGRGVLKPIDAYCAYAFSWASVVYGPIQLGRILTQQHRWAIADQWATLPPFSWVLVWGLGLRFGWSWCRMIAIMSASIASYSLTQYMETGFEISLAIHTVLAVAFALIHLWHHHTRDIVRTFVLALACCSGFVVLKVADHELAKLHPIFSVASGHFLSKIADFLQIYYVLEFFYLVTQSKYALERACKKVQ